MWSLFVLLILAEDYNYHPGANHCCEEAGIMISLSKAICFQALHSQLAREIIEQIYY